MKKDIILINVPYSLTTHKPSYAMPAAMFPMGLGYMAAMLARDKIKVEILDLAIKNMSRNKLTRYLKERNPAIVGISSMSPQYQNVRNIASLAKKANEDTVVVYGGIHASLVPDEVLNDCRNIDYILMGEAEYTISLFVKKILNGKAVSDIPGIRFRGSANATSLSRDFYPSDLDSLPYPAYHLSHVHIDEYFKHANGYKKTLGMITSRGCPHHCPFCSTAEFHGRVYRKRSVDSVIDEIRYFKDKYNSDRISFVDDSFACNKQWLFDVCHAIENKVKDIKWGCSARLDELDYDVLKTMASAGCNAIFIGIESLSQKVQRDLKKVQSFERLDTIVAIASKLSIALTLAFIVGFPGETASDRDAIIEYVKNNKTDVNDWRFSFLSVLPGTRYWNKCQDYSLDLSQINAVDPAPYPRSYLKKAPWKDLLLDVIKMYHSFLINRSPTGKLFDVMQPDVRLT